MISKTILFDIGNVIINFDHRIAINKIAKFTDKSPDDIYRLIFESKIMQDFEKGKLSSCDFFEKFKRIISITNLKYHEFLPIWNEIFSENREVIDIVYTLKENNYKIIIISNVDLLHLDYAVSNFEILKKVDKIIASCEVGYRKPQPEIYQLAVDYAQEKPQNLPYIDDLLELVQGGKEFGLYAIQFKNAKQLREDLIDYGMPCLASIASKKKFDK